MGGIKLSVDMAIGATSKIESEDKSKIDNIVTKVKELNARLTDVRREQVFQRVRTPKPYSTMRRQTDQIQRSEKLSSETRARPPTQRSYGGH